MARRCEIVWGEHAGRARTWIGHGGGERFEINRVWPRQKRFFLERGGKDVGEYTSLRAAKTAACDLLPSRRR